MIGPIDDRSILRTVRVACTPTIDGCEHGPTKLGVIDLAPRHPLRRGPRWQEVSEAELPPSVTVYDHQALEALSGCCSTFDSMPTVAWADTKGWETYLDDCPTCGGLFEASWNAHLRGSLIFFGSLAMELGFTVVDIGTRGGQGG